MAALATFVDVLSRLGHEPSDVEETRINALLADASAAVRRYTSQELSEVVGDTVRLRVVDGRILLPQRPVSDIEAITVVGGSTVEFTWHLGDEVAIGNLYLNRFDVEPLRYPFDTYVDVIYTHGYNPVPDDVIGVVCQIVARALGRAPEMAGVTQETVGPFSYSVGSAAGAGPFGLLADEKAILDTYRRPGVAWMV